MGKITISGTEDGGFTVRGNACPFHVGQEVKWDGQEGTESGIVASITEPFPGNYVLWIDRAGVDFPINADQVREE